MENYGTYQTFNGDGVKTEWDFTFQYISNGSVKALTVSPSGAQTPIVPALIAPNRVRVTPAVPLGTKLIVYRDSANGGVPLVDFITGSRIREGDLETANKQAIFVATEASDRVRTFSLDAAESAAQAKASGLQAISYASTAGTYATAASSSAAGAASSMQGAADARSSAIIYKDLAASSAAAARGYRDQAMREAMAVGDSLAQVLRASASAASNATAASSSASQSATSAEQSASSATAAATSATEAYASSTAATTANNSAEVSAYIATTKAAEATTQAAEATAAKTAAEAAAAAAGTLAVWSPSNVLSVGQTTVDLPLGTGNNYVYDIVLNGATSLVITTSANFSSLPVGTRRVVSILRAATNMSPVGVPVSLPSAWANSGALVGPTRFLTVVFEKCKYGNFVEISRSTAGT